MQDVTAAGDGAGKSTATLLTVTEAAASLGLSCGTISGWITRGVLPATLLAGRRRLRPDDLRRTQARMHAGVVVPTWRREPQRAGWRLRRLREAAQLIQLELAARSVTALLKSGRLRGQSCRLDPRYHG